MIVICCVAIYLWGDGINLSEEEEDREEEGYWNLLDQMNTPNIIISVSADINLFMRCFDIVNGTTFFSILSYPGPDMWVHVGPQTQSVREKRRVSLTD
jgi:hypothetical protein